MVDGWAHFRQLTSKNAFGPAQLFKSLRTFLASKKMFHKTVQLVPSAAVGSQQRPVIARQLRFGPGIFVLLKRQAALIRTLQLGEDWSRIGREWHSLKLVGGLVHVFYFSICWE